MLIRPHSQAATPIRGRARWVRRLLALFCGLGLAAPVFSAGTSAAAGGEELSIFVSILPQKHFVERIAGAGAEVSVLVGPGRSPATYEPTPKQMSLLSEADILFTVGVPFEAIWLGRIRAMNPELRIVANQPENTRDAAPLHGDDPHAWTSPAKVKSMSAAICSVLCAEQPMRCEGFTENLRRFVAELDSLDAEIRELFARRTGRRFMVYHPAWSYFAAAYGLEQVAIEREGKEPGARSLAGLIDSARAGGVRVIFVQAQFHASTAQTVAEAIGASLVSIDPLAEDYGPNLRQVAQAIAEGLY